MNTKLRATILTLGCLGLSAMPLLADKKFDDAVAKVEEQIRKEKTDEAIKTAEKLVEQQPGAEAQIIMSRLYERLGNIDGAAQALAQAVATGNGPSRAHALAAQAAFELRVSSGQQALGHAQDAVTLDATPYTLSTLARAQERIGDAPAALETAQRAVEAGPQNPLAHAAVGYALLGLGRNDEAIATFKQALSLAPKDDCLLCDEFKVNYARVEMARALLATGNAAEAIVVAREATEKDPQSGRAFAVLGAAILADDPKNWSDAIAQAQQGAFVNPKNPIVRVEVARIFEAAGNVQQAESAYRMALQVDPAYAPAQVALIQVQIRRGELEGALADAQKLVEKAPQSGPANVELGRILLRKGELKQAIAPLEAAVKYSPGVAEAQAMLGTAYQYTGMPDEAAASYEKAVELDPKNLMYRTTYGLLLGVTGRSADGIAELKKVIESPGYKETGAWTNLGWIYRNMDPRQPEESVAAYKKALELDPQNAQAALGMGWAYSYAKAWPEAIAAFEKGMQIEPKTASESYNGIAWCHYFNKEMTLARAFLKKAQDLDRNDTRLLEAIERYETAVAKGKAEAEKAMAEAEARRRESNLVARLIQTLRTGESAARARAALDLAAEAGAEAVPALTWALQEEDRDLRMAAAQALGNIGRAARDALPTLKHLIETQEDPPTFATREQLEQMVKDEDVRRAAKEAVRKIER